MSLRCLIVDDNPAFLAASRALLEGQGASVVGVATTAAEGIEGVQAHRPDVVLVDINLGPESGFDLARQLADGAAPLAPRVILISTCQETDFGDLITESPVLGFLPKSDLSMGAVQDLLRGSGAAQDDGA
jgi:DNA-binding NarL/FixJ family response regulator